MNGTTELTDIRMEDLADSMREIAELIGLKPALRLIASHGGCDLIIPTECGPQHPVCRAVGTAAAGKLATRFGGDRIYIQNLKSIEGRRRVQNIREDSMKGLSNKALAQRYGISVRQVRTIVGKAQP